MMAGSTGRFTTGRIYDCIRIRTATIVFFLTDIREESI